MEPTIETIANFCKKKGFVYPTAEIYGGFGGFFDYGTLGTELKNNIKKSWWNFLVYRREDIVGMDGTIITNPKVWKASGHLDNFGDLVITCKNCKTKIRADHFIEDTLKINVDGISTEEVNKLIKENNLRCPKCGGEFKEAQDFNTMFATQVGASKSSENTAYLRPETCQSIFINFKLIQEQNRKKLPFGIAQIGKVFRNEISPRDFLFRLREFEQMELEYFIHPEEKSCPLLTDKLRNLKLQFLSAERQEEGSKEMEEITIQKLLSKGKLDEWHAYWIAQFYKWFTEELKIKKENLRLREHVKKELSHYSTATFDFDYKFPFGFKELHGCANRGQYDLKQHIEHSKKNLYYFDDKTNKRIIPRVIEPSQGLDRLFLVLLFEAYNDDKERGNIVLKLPPKLAPYKVAVFPLVNKQKLPKKAKEIAEDLRKLNINVFYDKSGSIGRRYARQDEIGTPLCITVDFETLEDESVTVRDINTTKQERIKIRNLRNYILDKLNK